MLCLPNCLRTGRITLRRGSGTNGVRPSEVDYLLRIDPPVPYPSAAARLLDPFATSWTGELSSFARFARRGERHIWFSRRAQRRGIDRVDAAPSVSTEGAEPAPWVRGLLRAGGGPGARLDKGAKAPRLQGAGFRLLRLSWFSIAGSVLLGHLPIPNLCARRRTAATDADVMHRATGCC